MVDATPLNSSACERSERSLASNWCLLRGHYRFVLSEAGRQGALIRVQERWSRLVIGESGSDNATRSRIKIDATNRRNSGRLQCKNNAKFSDCFTGSRKSFSIKGRGSSVVEQPIRNRQVESSTLSLGSIFFSRITQIRSEGYFRARIMRGVLAG